jgi:hypothetical protein
MPGPPHGKGLDALALVPKTSGREAGLQRGDQPMAYEVAGLPPNLSVEVAEMDGRWQLLVVRDGEAGNWQGDFESPDMALAAIARALIDPRSR